MTVEARLITADELLRMPHDGYRYELVRGELRKMSPAGYHHGDIAMAIGAHLRTYVAAKRLGKVFAAETGFVLSRDPDTVLAPDAAFVRAERLLPPGPGYFPGPPDLAIEVISPSDLYTEVLEKTREWLHAGTPAVVVVEPRTQAVDVHRSSGTTRVTDVLELDDIVPGWHMPLAEVLAA